MAFTFRDSSESTGNLPLLIGLIGPSGGGKTFSALRLATGIQRIRGGNIAAMDSEAKRMLHYRDKFRFKHLEFGAPFSSARYMEAIVASAEAAAGGVVIVDSMSHEHEGEDGYLEYHEKELDRLVANSKSQDPEWKKREKQTFTAWIKPAAARRRLINTILRTDCAFIFNFRAKEKLKIIPGQAPINLGWQPIAGEEFAFEQTIRCLLPPGADGVPDWSANAFAHQAAKRGASFDAIVPDGAQLTEEIGQKLALWAKGTSVSADDFIQDIEKIGDMEALKLKFAQAATAFKDSPDFARIHAAKEKRKKELTQAIP